jgi:biopolymer transport protein ExbD
MLPKHHKLNLIKGVRSDINVTPLVDVCLVLRQHSCSFAAS